MHCSSTTTHSGTTGAPPLVLLLGALLVLLFVGCARHSSNEPPDLTESAHRKEMTRTLEGYVRAVGRLDARALWAAQTTECQEKTTVQEVAALLSVASASDEKGELDGLADARVRGLK